MAWYNPDWQYRKKITIDNAVVDTQDQSNFPFLIKLASDTSLAADAQDDGDDILFTSSNGTTKLSHEIEKFDGATGELWALVKIPTLDFDADMDIYLYYGNAEATSQQDVTNVWDSNFKRVAHLKETSGTSLNDSTVNNKPWTKKGETEPNPYATGKIDGAQDCDGANDYARSTDMTGLSDNTEGTIELWINWDAYSVTLEDIVWGFTGSASNNTEMFIDCDGRTNMEKITMVVKVDGTIQWAAGTAADSADAWLGDWHYFAFVHDGTEASFYVDGEPFEWTFGIETDKTKWIKAVLTDATTKADRNSLFILDRATQYGAFDGKVDEFRISDIDRSPSWIKTCYNNQNNPAGYITVGNREFGKSLQDSISITESVETYVPPTFSEELGDSIPISESLANQSVIGFSESLVIDELINYIYLTEFYVEGTKSKWKFKIKNPSTGKFIASLVNARKRWLTQRLNDQSEAGFILDADDGNANSTILNLGVNELYIYYDNSLMWGGQLVSAKKIASGDDIYWEVLAKDWTSLLSKRYCGVEKMREFTTTDAGQIAWTLIDEMQKLWTDTGWKSPTAYEDVHNVSNPEYAYSSNNQYADFTIHEAYCSYKTFNFDILEDATITGISISIEGYAGHDSNIFDICISWNGGTSWTNWQYGESWATPEQTLILGGSNDNWERSWSISEFSNDNLRIRAMGTGEEGNEHNYLDHIQVKVHYMIDFQNYSFGITQGTIQSSITRSSVYDRKNILEAIRELSNMGVDEESSYGFDFEVTPLKVFNVYYPYKGSVKGNVVFRYPDNCEDFEALVDSWTVVNHVWGLGRHWTGNTAIVSRSDATSQTAYKRREEIKNYRDVSVLEFLQDLVWQDVQWSKNPSTIVRFDSRMDKKTNIMNYSVGDSVAVICDKFAIDDFLWVYERKIQIGDNDEIITTLTVGE